MEKIKQLSVFLENRPGRLAGMMKALADAGVNIVTLSLANAPEFGIVRVIADDNAKGAAALAAAGFAARETEVVAVTVPDRPGGMAELTAELDRAGVNIEYSYAYSLGHGEKAVLLFKFDDDAKAEAALSSV